MRVGRVPQATTPSACMRHHKTVEFPDKVCRGREKRTRETARGDSHSCNGRILTHTAMQLAITKSKTARRRPPKHEPMRAREATSRALPHPAVRHAPAYWPSKASGNANAC